MPKNLWWSDDAMYLAERVYPNLALQAQGDGSWLSRRAILAAKNDDVRETNLRILDTWPGDAIDLLVEFLQKQCNSSSPPQKKARHDIQYSKS